MIVDDQAVVRRGLQAFLESEPDLEVVGDADGGTQALEVLAGLDSKGRRPDVVLMDLQMEPVDGVESTRAIRSRYSDVEVVALTSFAEQDRVRGALAAARRGGLKDAEADEIAAGIRAAHRGELRLDPTVARRLMSMLRGAPKKDLIAQLTPRELEVLRLVELAGRTSRSPPNWASASGRPARTCRTS